MHMLVKYHTHGVPCTETKFMWRVLKILVVMNINMSKCSSGFFFHASRGLIKHVRLGQPLVNTKASWLIKELFIRRMPRLFCGWYAVSMPRHWCLVSLHTHHNFFSGQTWKQWKYLGKISMELYGRVFVIICNLIVPCYITHRRD